MCKKTKMNVAIPFEIGGSKWNNKELLYCLRSFDKYIQPDKVYILGMKFPEWLKNVEKVVVPRVYPEVAKRVFGKHDIYGNFWDTMNKIKWCADNNIGDFLWCYDDIVALREPHLEELHLIVAQNKINEAYRDKIMHAKTRWGRTIRQALITLNSIVGGYIYNFEHHLPLPYKSRLLKSVLTMLDPYKEPIPYAVHTVYFNYILLDYEYIQTLETDWDYGVRMYNDFATDFMARPSGTSWEVIDNTRNKLWLNYNDSALHMNGISRSSPLKEFLEHSFPLKSKYER